MTCVLKRRGKTKMRACKRNFATANRAIFVASFLGFVGGCCGQTGNGNTTGPGQSPGQTIPWDSGEQQCQLEGKKIVYRFWQVNYNPSSTTPSWEVRYMVRAENSGPGAWHNAFDLYSLYYYFKYNGTTVETSTLNIQGHDQVAGYFIGHGGSAPSIQIMDMRVERGGGAHGIHVNWPNGQGCVFS